MTKPLYFYNGTTFELVGPTTPQSPIAYQTSAPTAPATGDLWIDSDGDVDTYNRQLTRYYYVATASQTTITGVDANGLTLAYVAGSEAVYVNGALQVRGQDYTATNGTSVVMSSGLAVNDVVEIFAYTAFTVANAYTKSETDGVAAAAAGLRMVVPTSVSVGSGSGSVDANGAVTFSGASSISLNNCLTSTYDNYKLMINITAKSAAQPLNFRLRSGTTDHSTADYRGYYAGILGATETISGYDGQTSAIFTDTNANGYLTLEVDLFNPNLSSTTTTCVSTGVGTSASDRRIYRSGYQMSTNSFDGLTLFVGGTITGTVRIYGYKD